MIPYTYHMVDMGGIDLAAANHTVVEGIFSKIEDALDDTRVLVLYNMYFSKIRIPPAYCSIVAEGGAIYINDSIEVSANDEVTVIALPPPLEPVIPLSVDDNGVYAISPPQSGYNPVTVALQFTELSANENGVYTPESPSRGFSKVTVGVPQLQPVIEPLSVTENGTYTAPAGTDGYSPISVNIPARTPRAIWDFTLGRTDTVSGGAEITGGTDSAGGIVSNGQLSGFNFGGWGHEIEIVFGDTDATNTAGYVFAFGSNGLRYNNTNNAWTFYGTTLSVGANQINYFKNSTLKIKTTVDLKVTIYKDDVQIAQASLTYSDSSGQFHNAPTGSPGALKGITYEKVILY